MADDVDTKQREEGEIGARQRGTAAEVARDMSATAVARELLQMRKKEEMG